MTFNIYTFNNYHGSCPVSFLYFLYKLDQILSIKMLNNLLNLTCQFRYSDVNILLNLIIFIFYIIASQFKSFFFHIYLKKD